MPWNNVTNLRGDDGATGPTGPPGPVLPHMPLVYFITVPAWIPSMAPIQNLASAIKLVENHLNHAKTEEELERWKKKHQSQVRRLLDLKRERKRREDEVARMAALNKKQLPQK